MKKYCFVVALGLLLTLASNVLADEFEPPTGTVALICKRSQHAQLLTQTISIDYDKKLVDGISANFTASMITWTVENGSRTEHHELNRITGTYIYSTDGGAPGEPLPTFSCEKAPLKF